MPSLPSESLHPRVSAKPSRTFCFTFFDLRAPLKKFQLRKNKMFCEAGRRFAAAGGGSAILAKIGSSVVV